MSKLFQWKRNFANDSSDEDLPNEVGDYPINGDNENYKRVGRKRSNVTTETGSDSNKNFENDSDGAERQRNARNRKKKELFEDNVLQTTDTSSSHSLTGTSQDLYREKINKNQTKSYKSRRKNVENPEYFSNDLDSLFPVMWDANREEEISSGVNYDQLVQDYGLNINILKHDLPMEILRARLYNMNIKFTEKFSFLLKEFSTREKNLQELNYGLKVLNDKLNSQDGFDMAIKDLATKITKFKYENFQILKSVQNKVSDNESKINEILNRIENLEKVNKESELKGLQDFIAKEVIAKNEEIERCRKTYDETILDLKSQLALLQKQGEQTAKEKKENTNTIQQQQLYYSINKPNYSPENSFENKSSCVLLSASQTNQKVEINRYNEALVGFLQQRCVNLEKALLLAGTSRYASSIAHADSGIENLSGQTIQDLSKYEFLGRSRDSNTLNSAISTLKTLLISKEKDINTLESEIKRFAEQMSILIQDNIEKDLAIERIKVMLKEENVVCNADIDPIDKPRKLSEIDISIRNIIHTVKEEKSLKEVKAKLVAANVTILRREQGTLEKDKEVLELNQKISDYEDKMEKLKIMFKNEIERKQLSVEKSSKSDSEGSLRNVGKIDEGQQTDNKQSIDRPLSKSKQELSIDSNNIPQTSASPESSDSKNEKSLRSIIIQGTLELNDLTSKSEKGINLDDISKNKSTVNLNTDNNQTMTSMASEIFSKVSTTDISSISPSFMKLNRDIDQSSTESSSVIS